MRKLTILIGFVVAFTTNWTRTATRQGSDNCALNVGLDLRDADPKVLREVERRWIEAYGQSVSCWYKTRRSAVQICARSISGRAFIAVRSAYSLLR
jgi:hypothetical protein